MGHSESRVSLIHPGLWVGGRSIKRQQRLRIQTMMVCQMSGKLERGLNPKDPADRNKKDTAGYTMLELYLNELVEIK